MFWLYFYVVNSCFLLDTYELKTREKQARTKSAELLKKELENEENLGCTEYLTKVSSLDYLDWFCLFLIFTVN